MKSDLETIKADLKKYRRFFFWAALSILFGIVKALTQPAVAVQSYYGNTLALLPPTVGADTTAPAAIVTPPDPGTTRAHLDWSDYNKNKLSTNLTFRVHWSATLSAALTNWLVVATVVGTNTQADVVIPSVDGNSFFAVSGSNLFGQKFFSNIATLSPPVDAFVPVKVIGVERGK